MKGAFQISREMFDHSIWNDVPKFRIFFFILGNAVFSNEGVKKGNVLIKRGQYLRSYRNLQSDLEYIENRAVKKYSLSVVKRKISSLVDEKMLEIEETELGTLFTVVNYAEYQGFERYKNTTKNSVGTALEHSENGDGTGMEQGWNNNKNVKKEKNVKEKREDDEESVSQERPKVKGPLQFTDNQSAAIRSFSENISIASPLVNDSIAQWVEDFEDQGDIVIAAIKIAAMNNGRTWTYVESILKNWSSQNVTSLEGAKRAYEDFQQQKDKKAGGNKKSKLAELDAL